MISPFITDSVLRLPLIDRINLAAEVISHALDDSAARDTDGGRIRRKVAGQVAEGILCQWFRAEYPGTSREDLITQEEIMSRLAPKGKVVYSGTTRVTMLRKRVTDLLNEWDTLVPLQRIPPFVVTDGRRGFGRTTGATKPCHLEGCIGTKVQVKWPGIARTSWICLKGLTSTNLPGVERLLAEPHGETPAMRVSRMLIDNPNANLPEHPREQWMNDVANDRTSMGYREWAMERAASAAKTRKTKH